MTKHLNEGQLRAALDGELDHTTLQHLESCAGCQQCLEALQAQTRQVAGRLAFLSAGGGKERVPAAGPALDHFYNQTMTIKEKSMFSKLFASRLVRTASAVALILALVLAIPATRAMASQLLSLFRVQTVTVLPIDFTGMQDLSGNTGLTKQISQFISSSTTVTEKPAGPVTVADAAEASQKTGFNVRLPQGMTPDELSVQSGGAFSFKVDRAKAQALLDEAGRKDLVLPASVDGADVSVTVPDSVSATYGTCPKAAVNRDPDQNTFTMESSSRNYPDCFVLAEIPSPVVSAPADVNVEQLAEIALQFTGMTQQQAADFAKNVDWTSSLVIPIPKNAVTNEQVQVDGVAGTLIQRAAGDSPEYLLVWVKDGIIYTISGLGSDSQKALEMAASLH
jgi:hypothetical protein